jgi:hypothetical protein
MRNQLIALISLSLTAAACGNAGIPNPTVADDTFQSTETAKAKPAKTAKSDAKGEDDLSFLYEQPEEESADEPTSTSPLAQRQVGDFTVHRFSGSFTKTPMTLTEEVVARAGGLIVVDYTLDQGKSHEKLRVTHDVQNDRVLRVREIHGQKELASSTDAYDAMIAKTMFVPDSNEAAIGDEPGTCLVAGKELQCEKKSYRVKIGDQTATLSLSLSDGQDIGGEISAPDGKIFYRAELVQTRSGTPSNVASR